MNTHTMDVLIVYTQSNSMSASSKLKGNVTPFALSKGREHYAPAYAYFLAQCKKIGLKAAFATSKDIVGPGTCSSYWTYDNSGWKKVVNTVFSPMVFDKVSPVSLALKNARAVLFRDGISTPFNDPLMLNLFNDKLKTFTTLHAHTIPTVNINKGSIEKSLARLEKLIASHENYKDFSKSFVLKDRFGAGGIDIYKIGNDPIAEIKKILLATPGISFILQPFTKFDKGYQYNGEAGYADIRIIYSQGEVVQRYVRTAKQDDFRCNEHQGGKVSYIESQSIPDSVRIKSDAIIKLIKGEGALFALDFIISNNGNVYFLEGNINPGIYWGINSVEDKINTKKLIVTIVGELKRRTEIANLGKIKLRLKEPLLPLLKFV